MNIDGAIRLNEGMPSPSLINFWKSIISVILFSFLNRKNMLNGGYVLMISASNSLRFNMKICGDTFAKIQGMNLFSSASIITDLLSTNGMLIFFASIRLLNKILF